MRESEKSVRERNGGRYSDQGGSVVDGTGAPARTADEAIPDGRVTTIKEPN